MRKKLAGALAAECCQTQSCQKAEEAECAEDAQLHVGAGVRQPVDKGLWPFIATMDGQHTLDQATLRVLQQGAAACLVCRAG